MANIIYEDKDILVCHKQAGIAVQTRRIGQMDMESELRNYRISQGEEPYIGVIHRLDQPVEGLIVFAKNPVSAAKLSKQVAMRQFVKCYYALVHMPEKFPCEDLSSKDSWKKNEQSEESAWITLTDYLVQDGKTNTSRVVSETEPEAKRAILEYHILKCRDGIALLDIRLRTGRHHQIRVQMAHAGMPLVGDRKYGDDNSANRGLALCAYRLEFTHPASGEKMSFEITPQWIGI